MTIRVSITRKTEIDQAPDLSHLTDSARLADLSAKEAERYSREDLIRFNGYGIDWHMVGIMAEAEIEIEAGQGGTTRHTITSSGLWGIESDAGFDFFNSVYEEETTAILDTLKQLTGATDIQVVIN